MYRDPPPPYVVNIIDRGNQDSDDQDEVNSENNDNGELIQINLDGTVNRNRSNSEEIISTIDDIEVSEETQLIPDYKDLPDIGRRNIYVNGEKKQLVYHKSDYKRLIYYVTISILIVFAFEITISATYQNLDFNSTDIINNTINNSTNTTYTKTCINFCKDRIIYYIVLIYGLAYCIIASSSLYIIGNFDVSICKNIKWSGLMGIMLFLIGMILLIILVNFVYSGLMGIMLFLIGMILVIILSNFVYFTGSQTSNIFESDCCIDPILILLLIISSVCLLVPILKSNKKLYKNSYIVESSDVSSMDENEYDLNSGNGLSLNGDNGLNSSNGSDVSPINNFTNNTSFPY